MLSQAVHASAGNGFFSWAILGNKMRILSHCAQKKEMYMYMAPMISQMKSTHNTNYIPLISSGHNL